MKTQTPIALAAALLLSGVTAASAAGMAPSPSARDTLNLTATQQKAAWNDLRSQAKQNAPSGFTATVGSVVPGTLQIEPVPSKAASAVPALRPYDFAMVKGKLLIVNPSDKKIVAVITG